MEHADHEAEHRLERLAERHAFPSRRLEGRAGGGFGLLVEALEKVVQQPLLVVKTRVESADGGAGTFGDFSYARALDALFGEHGFRGIEQALERLLAARLLRRADPFELSRGRHGVGVVRRVRVRTGVSETFSKTESEFAF